MKQQTHQAAKGLGFAMRSLAVLTLTLGVYASAQTGQLISPAPSSPAPPTSPSAQPAPEPPATATPDQSNPSTVTPRYLFSCVLSLLARTSPSTVAAGLNQGIADWFGAGPGVAAGNSVTARILAPTPSLNVPALVNTLPTASAQTPSSGTVSAVVSEQLGAAGAPSSTAVVTPVAVAPGDVSPAVSPHVSCTGATPPTVSSAQGQTVPGAATGLGPMSASGGTPMPLPGNPPAIVSAQLGISGATNGPSTVVSPNVPSPSATAPAVASTQRPVASGATTAPVAAAGAASLYAGFAFEVHAIGPGSSETTVNPATYIFHSGDRFLVYYRPSLPGRISVFNVNSLGEVSQIESRILPGGELAKLGPYQLTDPTGDEKLRLVLQPCSTPELLAATRNIVKADSAPVNAGADLRISTCDKVSSLASSAGTRNIVKVAMDGKTGFALDPVNSQELKSGRLLPRETSITIRHQ